MPYIALEDHLPGIIGLLNHNKGTAQPIRTLTQPYIARSSSVGAWMHQHAREGIKQAYIINSSTYRKTILL